MELEPVIGLEVHVQLSTKSKIFCSCSNAFGAPPNTSVCPVCLGYPGTLPVLNREVVEFALRLALAAECRIRQVSGFARKNYFYPDLPKGYQISQFEEPLAENGRIAFDSDGREFVTQIRRMHLEEDAGKTIHDPKRGVSLLDFNRCGAPLVEIVTEPDLRAPAHAAAVLQTLRRLVRWLDVSDGNMEEGSLRCDANVSLRPRGSDALGVKVELKNMNSFRFVEQALHHEIARQQGVLARGDRVVQETRLWDEDARVTRPMRGKEEAFDYRYFPEPDLGALMIDNGWLVHSRAALPELPRARAHRFVETLGVRVADAVTLTQERALAEYAEAALAAAGGHARAVGNWLVGPLLRHVKALPSGIAEVKLEPVRFARLVAMVEEGIVSAQSARELLPGMLAAGGDPESVFATAGAVITGDDVALEGVVEEVLARHPAEVGRYRAGKAQLLGFFVGEVMRAAHGRAQPHRVSEILRRQLEGAS